MNLRQPQVLKDTDQSPPRLAPVIADGVLLGTLFLSCIQDAIFDLEDAIDQIQSAMVVSHDEHCSAMFPGGGPQELHNPPSELLVE
ncbi:MAG: hypothetical protein RL885_28895 [Planctomycetota bacterium]